MDPRASSWERKGGLLFWLLCLFPGAFLLGQPSLENALVWPQFVAGGAFDAELRISNTSSAEAWSGRLRLADQQTNPLAGVSIELADGSSGAQPQGSAELSLNLPPRGSVLVRFSSASSTPIVGFMTVTPEGSATLEQLVADFAYNLKSESGAVVDRIPVPPVRAGTAFFTTLGRQIGFDAGIAAVSLEATTLEITLHRTGQEPISTDFPLLGQSAFFPSALLDGVPENLSAGLLELRSPGVPVAVTSLDVVAPPLGTAVQIAGKSLKRASAGCQDLATGLTFADPAPASAGFALYKTVADDQAVYWFDYDASLGTAGGSLKRADKEGGSVFVLAEGLGGVNDFAVDSTSLFWSEFEVQSGAGAIKRVSKTGGGIVTLASGTPAGSAFSVFNPLGIALDDSFVYWGESSGGGAVRRVPKAGGMVVDIGRGQGFGPVSLVLDGGFFYGGAGDQVARLPLQGGNLQTLASSLQNPMSVLTDEQFVYWVELAENGRAARVPKGGGDVALVAGGLSNVRSLALDGTFVYFPSSPSGQGPSQPSVRRAPKPGGTVETAAECAGATALVAPIFVTLDADSFFVTDNVQAGQARVVRAPR